MFFIELYLIKEERYYPALMAALICFSLINNSSRTVSHSSTLFIANVSLPTTCKPRFQQQIQTLIIKILPLVQHEVLKYETVYVTAHQKSFLVTYFFLNHSYQLDHSAYHMLRSNLLLAITL